VQGCAARLDTEATWAAEVIRQADDLISQGRREDAVAMLRAAARRNFAQAALFAATAQAMIDSSSDSGGAQEAIYWARRACQVTRFRDAGALTTLAAAYAAAGQFRDAIDAARRAKEIALTEHNQDLAMQLDVQLHAYERAAPSGE